MPFKRILLLIGVVFALTGAGLAGARRVARERPPYYNCLRLTDGTRVQLNTHLAVPLHEISISPDGNARLLLWDDPQAPRLVVEDRRSGAWHIISAALDQPFILVNDSVIWSPDHAFLAYTAHPRGDFTGRYFQRYYLVDVQAGQQMPLLSAEVVFSATGDYVLLPEYGMVYATRLFALIAQGFSPTGTGLRYFAWSPTGNRLAFVSPSPHTLSLYDFDQQQVTPTPLSDLSDFLPARDRFASVAWSPDGAYLAVYDVLAYEGGQAPNAFAEFLAVSGAKATSLTQFQTKYAPEFINADEVVYLRAAPAADTEQDAAPQFDLWHINLATQQEELVVANVNSVDFNGDYWALLRNAPGDTLQLEIRDRDGSNPIPVHTFPAEATRNCVWADIPVQPPVVACATQNARSVMLFDVQGATLWSPDDARDAETRFQGNPATSLWITPEGRFILLTLYGADDAPQMQLVDRHTHQTYVLPDDVLYATNYSFFGDELVSTQRFDVFPWPDDNTQWAVRLGTLTFRFDPADDTWEQESYVSPEVWSPGGERVAYARAHDSAMPYSADLIVQDADGSRQWLLGRFSTWMVHDMQWTQCGDVLAPLRDRLAVQ